MIRPLLVLLLLFAGADALAQATASQRLDKLAAEAQERALDLFRFSETMGKGAGPRQDKVELTFSADQKTGRAAGRSTIS